MSFALDDFLPWLRCARGRRPWMPWELAFLREHYATTHSAVLAEIFGCSVQRVHAKATQLGLRKSIDTIAAIARQRTGDDHPSRKHRFVKGNVPANKGLRRPGFAPGRMASTQFKKGQPPHTWKPIGSVRVNADGYLDRKVSDTGYPPRDWVSVHRLVWTAAHGPVPPGHAVAFKPGRRTTDPALITLDALELVSRRDLMLRNSFRRYGPEVAQLVQLRGVLTRQINRKAKEAS